MDPTEMTYPSLSVLEIFEENEHHSFNRRVAARNRKSHPLFTKGIPKPQWFKEMVSKRHTGKIVSVESRRKMAEAKKDGFVPWAKGKSPSQETRMKISLGLKDYFQTHSNPMSGRKRSRKEKAFISRRTKERMQEWWNSLPVAEQERIRDQQLIGRIIKPKPTKHEKAVQSILERRYPNEWKYSGNGEVWIARRNPDFINCNGKKAVVEVFGDYWHSKDEVATLHNHYAKYGFSCLILWEHEIKKQSGLVEDKIASFMDDLGGN